MKHCPLLLVVLFSIIFAAPAQAYVNPATGDSRVGRVLVAAEIPEKNWQRGHRGVDLPMTVGSTVVAAGPGTVAFVGTVVGTPVISIDHPDGIRTTYLPVLPLVDEGEAVVEGAVIGRLAPAVPGHAGLHWGALTGPDTYMNPLLLLDRPEIRLKPVGELGGKLPSIVR